MKNKEKYDLTKLEICANIDEGLQEASVNVMDENSHLIESISTPACPSCMIKHFMWWLEQESKSKD